MDILRKFDAYSGPEGDPNQLNPCHLPFRGKMVDTARLRISWAVNTGVQWFIRENAGVSFLKRLCAAYRRP